MMKNATPLQYPLPTRIVRILLTQNWYACSGANGTIQGYGTDADGNIRLVDTLQPVWLYDPDGMIAGELLASEDNISGELFIPSGYIVKGYQPEDSNDGHYELVHAGIVCPFGTSGEGSGDNGSGEEGSGDNGSGEEGSGESGSGSEGSGETSSSATPSSCTQVTGVPTTFPNYNPAVIQALVHDANNCYAWLDVGCSSSSGSGSTGD